MKAIVSFIISFIFIGGFMIPEIIPLASPSDKSDSDFASALLAKSPSTELGDAASVYAWLIGSWDVRVIDHQSDGSKHESTGEWHFSWSWRDGRCKMFGFLLLALKGRLLRPSREIATELRYGFMTPKSARGE